MRNLIQSLVLVLLTLSPLLSYASAAHINIKISSSVKDNRYFLCLPSVGCLSIRAAQRGKVFQVYRDVSIKALFVTNIANLRVQRISLPASCAVTVEPNQTITIYGKILSGKNQVQIQQLRCTLRTNS